MDPVTRAFALQEQLNHLAEAHQEGADVSPQEFIELEAQLEVALEAEAELSQGWGF